jgi:hypothetical protein
VTPLALSTVSTIPNKSHKSLKLLNRHTALYILMHTAAILIICHIIRKLLIQQWIRSAWSVGTAEKFYTNKKTSNVNQPNDKHTITLSRIFESILRGKGCVT